MAAPGAPRHTKVGRGLCFSSSIARPTGFAELSQLADDAKVVVAHNAGFDGSVIAAEYLRLGLEPPFVPSSMICTMTQSPDYCRLSGPHGNKWPKLDELHMFLFGTVFGGAHDAARTWRRVRGASSSSWVGV